MVNRKYVLKILIILLISMLVLSQASAKPSLSNPLNNKTNNANLGITVNETDTVRFSIETYNESVNVTWNWFVNGSSQSGDNHSYFIYQFNTSANKEIEVNLKNITTNQTSDPITWIVTVQPPPPPEPSIIDWNNNITNNKSTSFEINRSDSVEFNATANQTITTWNWYIGNSKKITTTDTFIYKFDNGGDITVTVNATNSNGTSNSKKWTVSVLDTEPPGNITNLNNTIGTTWIRWTWTNPSTDFDHVEVYINETQKPNVTTNYYNATSLDQKTSYKISLRPVDASGNKGNWSNGTASTDAEKPVIVRKSPSDSTLDSEIETKVFSIQLLNQDANVTWTGAKSQTNNSVSVDGIVYLNFTPTSKGNYTISVNATNENGTSNTISWVWKVRPSTYSTGNRIWDGERNPDDFSKTYSWTPQSFSGFYYDLKDGIGKENIKIELNTRSHGTVSKNHITYTTEPQEVYFNHEGWGNYQVIGFMADKYFAGYKNHTIPEAVDTFGEISTIAQGQLHKVLFDDDTKRTISVGGTLALKDGYVLKATDIDLNGRTMFLVLLKDGNEVDSNMLRGGDTYVYKKRVGGVDDLPLILVRFDGVFAGTELQAAFLKGIFQISEDVTQVKSGNKFGVMEVTDVNKDKIQMKNSDTDVGLNKGSIVDLMGDLKIIVADNEKLRFALSVDRKGSFEVRSTVFDENNNNITEWTPYNFGMNIGKTIIGFYYNLDDGLGNEMLSMTERHGSSIPEGKLVYTTEPEQVLFTHDEWGKYQVIGFMADKYFAGYKGHDNSGMVDSFSDTSAMAQGQLHKILIDDDTKRTISVGGTLALKDGYVLKATDIDLRGRTMFLVLLKDGTEVDSNMLQGGETYVYKKKVGNVDDLPLILVRFDNVFAGTELQAAFIKGIFQISETATKTKIGDQIGKMEVTSVNNQQIQMKNSGDIGLNRNTENVLMGNIKLKVADSNTIRFYFAVDVTEDMIADQLVIDVPQKAMAGDNINIKVTAGGKASENASLTLDTDIGTTDSNGILNYSIPKTLKNGTYTITATKTGYEKATKNIEIEKYVDYRLSIEAPSNANQYETIKIKVLYNGTAMSGASVMFDNISIGSTDSNGEVSYRLETSGTHSITASKQSYISVSRDLDIRAPYSEFKALDINITPNPVFTGDDFVVKSNITNVGTKSDTLPVELIINGSAVENRSVTLAAGEKAQINFTRNEAIAANITVVILGQSNLLIVQQKPINYFLIAAIATGIGAVIIYVLTSKGLLSLELLKQKFGELSEKFNLLFKK